MKVIKERFFCQIEFAPTKRESRSTNGCLEFPGSVRNLTPAVEFLGERVRETKRFGDFDASTFFPE